MNKIFALVQNRIRKYTSRKLKFTIHPLQKEHLGSKYGGWVIPCNYLTNKSVCYFAGAGEDISFDVAVAGKYGSEIHIFDPTPRAKRHFQKLVTGTTNGEKVF